MRSIAKKILALLMLLIMIMGTACSFLSKPKDEVKAPVIEKEPFSFNTTQKDSEDNLFGGESVASLFYATPFYGGAPEKGQKTVAFDDARANKVSEISTRAQMLRMESVTAANGLYPASSALLVFCDALKKAGKSQPGLNEISAKIKGFELNQTKLNASSSTFLAGYGSDALSSAFSEYMGTADSMLMADSVLKESEYIVTMAAVGIVAAEKSGDPALKAAAGTLDESIGSYVASSEQNLGNLTDGLATVDYGFRQLETADYYSTMAMADFIQAKAPEIAQKLAAIKPQGKLTAEHLVFFKKYNDYFVAWSSHLKQMATPKSKGRLLAVEPSPVPFGWWTAYAETSDEYGKAVTSLSTDIPEQKPTEKGYLGKGWDALKGAVKSAKNVAGVTVDLMGNVVYDTTRKAMGAYYGNTNEEITKDIKEERQQIMENSKKGASGSETMKNAGGYLKGADQAVGNVLEGAVSSIPLPGSKMAGSVANVLGKITTSMFTDLGKGIFKIADTQSTKGDIAEGMLDVGLSCLGGSKVLFRASIVTPAMGKTATLVAKDAVKFGETAVSKEYLSGLNAERKAILAGGELGAAEFAGLWNTEKMIQATETALKSLESQRSALTEEFAKILKEGGELAWENAKDTLKESLQSNFRESIRAQVKEALEAIVKDPGKAAVAYMDEIMSQVSDDAIKSSVNDFVDSVASADVEPGEWIGTLNFDTVYHEGNNGAELNIPEGTILPLGIRIITANADGGEVQFRLPGHRSDPDEPVKEFPCTTGYGLSGIDFTAVYNIGDAGAKSDYFKLKGTIKGNEIVGRFEYYVHNDYGIFHVWDGSFSAKK